MQVEKPNYSSNNNYVQNNQGESEISQSSPHKEVQSIHIKMKNQKDQRREHQLPHIAQEQNKQNQDYENQVNINKLNSSSSRIGSQTKIGGQNKQKVYKQEDSNRRLSERKDVPIFNVIHVEDLKGQKQEMELMNNVNDIEEETLLSPSNKIIKSKFSVDNTLFSLFFTLITIAGIILFIIEDMYWLIILGATLYYLECLCTSFLDIFEKTISDNEFYFLYKNALNEEPHIQFKASAFMIVVKSKNKQNNPCNTNITNNNNTQQQGQQQANNSQKQCSQNNNKQSKVQEFIRVRELVYSEQRSFDFSQHKDFSHPLQAQKEFFQSHALIRIKPVLYWRCGNTETQEAYEKMQNEVIEISRQRSDDIEKAEFSYTIPFLNNDFIVKSSGKSSPIFFNRISYYIFSLLFLSFPFRIYYLNSIRTLELYICKKVFI
ncbi:transmembrane protein, putative (macronuclear) [Tetrahymena thermophila SB210]|uniref:Transmembrane protein, putative n=1 Tax=Tetrahymena thermophila (strain SB210) TaxID=312017 RepID=Q22MW5_TETTS|nr:transmembrane protein, putative [Tetrahymena thermophila SB210]EAR86658.1 transmembrane protein, putative [Tetrahymena thermophila SB210]|eukprot:XP_976905.1 transmembrane protein, putative [Tetrahymena thermophila SB210]